MKKFIFLLLSLYISSSFSLAGGSRWPGVKYSYAMVYLYNVDGNLRGSHQILKEGKLDKTVQGEGKKLSGEQTSKLEKIFASGAAIDELVNGLSGCYIPRHAIVYYNEKDEAVASMSICFECEGIRFYSPSYPRNHYASSDKTIKEAETKLSEIKEIIKALGIKTDFKASDTISEKKTEQNEGEITITDDRAIANLFPEKITFDKITRVIPDTSGISVEVDEKYTYGGDKYVFTTVLKGNSVLKFSGTESGDQTLEYIDLQWVDVVFGKLRADFTLDEVLTNMGTVYDGPAHPQKIILQNTSNTKIITFNFFEDKLSGCFVEIKAW